MNDESISIFEAFDAVQKLQKSLELSLYKFTESTENLKNTLIEVTDLINKYIDQEEDADELAILNEKTYGGKTVND